MPLQPGDRRHHPDLDWAIYADHAAIGPLADRTRDAVVAAADLQARQGVAAILPLLEAAEPVRARFAQLTGVDPEGVALTGSTSEGVVAFAQAVPWQSGDRIVLFEGEFPTNTTPWQQVAREHDLTLDWLPLTGFDDGSGDGLARVEAALNEGVRLIAVSAVQFQTGLRMPVEALAELAHAHDAWLFVDAIQGAGAVPLDLSAADGVACGGQKWLMGPIGTGVLAVAPHLFPVLEPRLASWLSHEDALRFLHDAPGHLRYDRPVVQGPAMFEGGTRNLPGLGGLAAALELAVDVGAQRTFDHAQAWNDFLEAGLLARGWTSERAADPGARSAILAVRPPSPHTAADVAPHLWERGVRCSTPDGRLRFAPSWPNDLGEPAVILDHLAHVERALG